MSTASQSAPQAAADRRPSTHPHRVLVVGETDLVDQVREALRPQNGAVLVDHVSNYLLALGDLARRSADVVVGPLEQREGAAAATARALRRVAPRATVLVAIEPGEEERVAALLHEGVDDFLLLPLDDQEVAEAVGLRKRTAGSASAAARGDTQPLGDVDLVEAVLTGKETLQSAALRLIEQQSGLQGLKLLQPEQATSDTEKAVPVIRGDQVLGQLVCPDQGSGTQLQAWAEWLGHWLALDRHVVQLHQLAMRDDLTSVWNRRYFDRFLKQILEHAQHDRSQVTLMLFDIDDFKTYNDRFGHQAGDEILRETAKLMQSVVREHDVVARIGGDEFAVIFWDAEPPRRPQQHPESRHPQDVLQAAKRFQSAVCTHRFPKLLDTVPGTLTISGGLASFPWDGRTPEELVRIADTMAMRSKNQGKNAITLGSGAMRRCNMTQPTA